MRRTLPLRAACGELVAGIAGRGRRACRRRPNAIRPPSWIGPRLDAADDIAVRGQAVVREAEADDLVVGGRRDVEVDEAVVGELWGRRSRPQQAAARSRREARSTLLDHRDRRARRAAVGQEADAAGSLGDERAAVGEPVDRPRRVQPGGDRADLQVRGALVSAAAAGQQHERRDAGEQAAHASSVPGDGAAARVVVPRFGTGGGRRLAAVRPGVRAGRGVAGAAGAGARSAEQMAKIFLAAIHAELLRDPDDELAAYYPTVGGRRAADAGLAAGARALLRARARAARATRSPPATRRRTRPRAARAAAGVRLRRGRAAARADRDRRERGAQRAVGPLRLRLRRARRGGAGLPAAGSRASWRRRVPPLEPPPVAWRAGIDLSPVDLRDEADVRWLRACLWPDQPARHARLDAALQVAREHGRSRSTAATRWRSCPASSTRRRRTHSCASSTPRRSSTSAREDRRRCGGCSRERDVAWIGGEAPGLLVEEHIGPTPHFALIGRAAAAS